MAVGVCFATAISEEVKYNRPDSTAVYRTVTSFNGRTNSAGSRVKCSMDPCSLHCPILLLFCFQEPRDSAPLLCRRKGLTETKKGAASLSAVLMSERTPTAPPNGQFSKLWKKSTPFVRPAPYQFSALTHQIVQNECYTYHIQFIIALLLLVH